MAGTDIRIALYLDARPAMRALAKFKADAGLTAKALRKIDKATGRTTKRVKGMALAFRDLRRVTQTVKAALIGFGAALVFNQVKRFSGSIIDAQTSIDKMRNSFMAATDSQSGAIMAMDRAIATADELGIGVEKAGLQMARMAAAGVNAGMTLRQAEDAFTAIGKASVAVGLSSEETRLALMAVEQMMSKGKVSAEELRRQLGERIPGAFGLAAKAMDVTTRELDKMLRTGQVMSSEFLPKFAKVLEERFAGAFENAQKTLRVAITRMQNQIFGLRVEIAERLSPVFAEAVREIGKFIERMKSSGDFTSTVDAIGESFTLLVSIVRGGELDAAVTALAAGFRFLLDTLNLLLKPFGDTANWFERLAAQAVLLLGAWRILAAFGAGNLASSFMTLIAHTKRLRTLVIATGASFTSAKHSALAFGLALNTVILAATVLIPLLLILNNRISEWKRRMQAAIEVTVESHNQFKKAGEALTFITEGLVEGDIDKIQGGMASAAAEASNYAEQLTQVKGQIAAMTEAADKARSDIEFAKHSDMISPGQIASAEALVAEYDNLENQAKRLEGTISALEVAQERGQAGLDKLGSSAGDTVEEISNLDRTLLNLDKQIHSMSIQIETVKVGFDPKFAKAYGDAIADGATAVDAFNVATKTMELEDLKNQLNALTGAQEGQAKVLADARAELVAMSRAAGLASKGFGTFEDVLSAIKDLTKDGIIPDDGSVNRLIEIRKRMDEYKESAEQAASAISRHDSIVASQEDFALAKRAMDDMNGGMRELQNIEAAIAIMREDKLDMTDEELDRILKIVEAEEERKRIMEGQALVADHIKESSMPSRDTIMGGGPTPGSGGSADLESLGGMMEEYSGASALVDLAVQGLDEEVQNMISATEELVLALLTDAPAGDWIGLIAQAAHALRMYRAEKNAERKNNDKLMAEMVNAARKLGDELEEVTSGINEQWDAVTKGMQEQVTKLEARIERMKVGFIAGRVSEQELAAARAQLADMTEALARVEQERMLELERATRHLQEKGFRGLISMFEMLNVHFAGTEKGERLLLELETLRMELEILNYKIQLDMLRTLGTIATETLDWIAEMIDEVEAGLRSGEFVVGGTPTPSSRSRGGGQNPRETLEGMMESLSSMAGIQVSEFQQVLDHTAEMREHVGKMRISEEERAEIAQRIADLEQQALDSSALGLAERIAAFTGDSALADDLAMQRADIERALLEAELEQFLLLEGLSDTARENLERARDALRGMSNDTDGARDSWLSFMSRFDTSGDQMLDLWNEYIAVADAAFEAGEITIDEFRDGLDKLRAEISLSALDLVDAALQFAGVVDGSEEAARLRFNIEKTLMLAQIRVMQATLAAIPGMEEVLELLNDAYDQVLNTVFVWDPNGGLDDGLTNIDNSIDDQTDRLEAALQGLRDLMDSLLVGSQSPLTPQQKFDFLSAEYQRLSTAAKGGDVEAMEQLRNIVPQMLTAAEALFGGTATSAYAAIFGQVIGDLAAITGSPNPLSGLNFPGASSLPMGNIVADSALVTSMDHGNQQAHTDQQETNEKLDGVIVAISDMSQDISDLFATVGSG